MRPTDPRLRRRLVPARRPLAGVVAGGVLASLLVIAQAWAVTGLVLAALHGDALGRPALLVVLVLAGRALAGWAVDACAARAAAVVGSDLRRRVVGAFLRDHDRRTPRASGELAVLATRGVSAAEPYLTRYVPALVLAAVLPPLTVVAIAVLDPLSAVIVLATLPLVPVFGALVGLATRDRAEQQWRAMSSLAGHFLDVVRGLPTLVAHRRAEAQSDAIRRVTDRYRRASLSTLRLAFASSAVLELVATLSVALVAVTVGVRLAAGDLGLHTALVVLLLAPEAYWPLRRVGAEFHAAAEGVATFERVSELVDAPPTRREVPGTSRRVGEGVLEVVDVTVRHPGRTAPALAGVSLVVPPRGVTVLTGPSGCGKSTLLATLAGLVAPESGCVRAGGADLREVDGAAWRAHVAWLPQRPVFVAGSIADNLRLADPDAPDERLWEVLRDVALEERVRTLPDGLAALVAEDGTALSAGERARLALARVVLARRPWVLLDEPTAHLDELTEQVIADTIVALGEHAGVVVVAHRAAMIELADHLVVLPRPRLREPGAPRAVLEPGRPGAAPPPAAPVTDPVAPRRGLALPTLLGALASASGVALTATAGWLIVQASYRPAVLTLLVAIVGVRTFGLARPVLRYAERLRSHDVALRLLAERRVAVYDTLVPLVPGRLGRRRGDLLASVVDDVDAVVDRALRVRLPLRGFLLVGGAAAAVATLLLPGAGPVVLLTGPGAGLLAFLLARTGGARAELRTVTSRAELSDRVVEAAQVAEELTMWQAEDRTVAHVGAAADALARAARWAAAWAAGARALVLVAAGAGVVATAWVAAPAVAAGTLSGPMLALLVLLPLALADVALPMADAGSAAARTRAAEARLEELEHLEPAVRSPLHPLPARGPFAVTVAGVTAGWDDRPALEGVDLRLTPGERVGVVGPTGCGKSTLAALLLRFIDPREGLLRLGTAVLPLLTLDDVRRHVGLVDDDPHVFATTVVENVRLARPGASDAEVAVALRQARLGPWLDSLPEGLHTWLGDGHAEVSGGERARLAIARSLLADQPVLVLDEPTAHLDAATAVELADEVLGDGAGERSVLWITHGTIGLDRLDRVLDLGVSATKTARRTRRGV